MTMIILCMSKKILTIPELVAREAWLEISVQDHLCQTSGINKDDIWMEWRDENKFRILYFNEECNQEIYSVYYEIVNYPECDFFENCSTSKQLSIGGLLEEMYETFKNYHVMNP